MCAKSDSRVPNQTFKDVFFVLLSTLTLKTKFNSVKFIQVKYNFDLTKLIAKLILWRTFKVFLSDLENFVIYHDFIIK